MDIKQMFQNIQEGKKAKKEVVKKEIKVPKPLEEAKEIGVPKPLKEAKEIEVPKPLEESVEEEIEDELPKDLGEDNNTSNQLQDILINFEQRLNHIESFLFRKS